MWNDQNLSRGEGEREGVFASACTIFFNSRERRMTTLPKEKERDR